MAQDEHRRWGVALRVQGTQHGGRMTQGLARMDVGISS